MTAPPDADARGPISVLLPYRDATETVADAARSVLADLDSDDELVAIDDGSSDGSAEELARLAAHDPRIVLARSGGDRERPAGIVTALGRGLAAARADATLIGRMDADDISLPGRVAAERALLAGSPSLGAVGVQVETFGEHEGMARYVAWQNALLTSDDHAREIFVEAPLCHPSVLLRRTALEQVGGFRDAPWPEDYDLWLRLDAAGFGLAKVPRVLFQWRMHGRSVTRTDPRAWLARLVEARAKYLAPRLARRAGGFAIWGAGKTGRRLARALEAHAVRPAFFADIDPRKIGRTARARPIVSAEEAILRSQGEAPSHLVVAVGEPGARDVVRTRLTQAGLAEGRDFVCAA